MLARKQLLVLSYINQSKLSYLSYYKLILLSVLCHYCITGYWQHITIYCLPVAPSSDHTKHLRSENDIHSSNTLAKPQIPLPKNYSNPANFSSIASSHGTSHRLLTHSGRQIALNQQPITSNSFVTIEINGTESSEIRPDQNQTFDDSQDPLASSESKPSVVVSHIMMDEDDPLPPMSILMSDSINGTNTGTSELTDDQAASIGGAEARLADVKNFMKLMRNSTSQWLGRSQALGATTSRRPELSPKSRKFLQDIKSKRKLSSPTSPMIGARVKSVVSSGSITQAPGKAVPGPIQSSLSENGSSTRENWIDYENQASSSRLNEDEREPLEESASTNSGRKAPLSNAEQQRPLVSSISEEEDESKPVVVSESATTTIEDDRGKKTVFRHGPGSSLSGASGGDNKLPAKLREKIINQFLKNGGDPQNIVVSDSTITTTSQSKRKTITTVYKIVPIESPVPARGVKSNGWRKSLKVESDHEDDEHEEEEPHMRPPHSHKVINLAEFTPPKSFVSHKGKHQRLGDGKGGVKKLKKIMVTRIEVPQRLDRPSKSHKHDESLGEFYSGPHETIFGHENQDLAKKDHSNEPHDLNPGVHLSKPQEEKHDLSTHELDEMSRKGDYNSYNRAKAHKLIKDHNLQSIDDSLRQKANDHPADSIMANDDDQEAGKKAPRKTLQVMMLKKSPSSTNSANEDRETGDQRVTSNESLGTKEDSSALGGAVRGKNANGTQEPEIKKPVQRSQNKGKPKSGRAKASRENPVPTLLPEGEEKLPDTDDATKPTNEKSAPPATTRRPAASGSRRPAGGSDLSKSQSPDSESKSITTKRPNNRKTKDIAKEQRDALASLQNDNDRRQGSGGAARSLSGSRGQAASSSSSSTSSTTTSTTTTTTTTTTTSTTTTPKPRPRTTTRAASTRRPVQTGSVTPRAPTTTTTTGAPASLDEDQPVVTNQDNQQSDPTSPPTRQFNSSGAKDSPASINRSQLKFRSTMVLRANSTDAATREPSATAPMNGAHQQERAHQQQQRQEQEQEQEQEQPMGKTRNIMMLIDFDAPPATSNENSNGVAPQAFNQRLPADGSDVTQKFKSESQQFEMPFVRSHTSDDSNQWRPMSVPSQRRPQPQQVSAPTPEANNSNSRQQAPTVSVQIYNNLARDQRQQQQPLQQETPLEQSTISPSDVDFIHQVATSAQSSNSRRQQQQHHHHHPTPTMQFLLEPSVSSSTGNSDPFEDFAATTPRARGTNGREFHYGDDLDNSSSFGGQHYQPPQRDAIPLLFASSSRVGQQNYATDRSTSGMQQVLQHARLQPPTRQQPGELPVLPDESAQTNRMLMRVIDEIAKSALASGYQVADSRQRQTTSGGIAHQNYLTPSSGDVSAPAESHEVDQVGESDSSDDEDGDENDHTSAADSMHYPLNLIAGRDSFPSPSRAAVVSLADLLMMNRAISDSRQRTVRATNRGI